MGGGGSKHETHYTYVDNTDEVRREARERETRRLENERKQKESEEKLRIEKEKQQEEERKKAEYREQREREIAEEEARKRKEKEEELKLENELRLRRAELFDYEFGNKTRLDSFRGLAIHDVTQLRIGVFGPTGSGKSCFINTCERTVRETEKGTAPDSTTGQEGTITLQDYLPEMFFHLVDTRGFFNYNANEIVEFRNILEGRIQPGDNVTRPPEGEENAAPMELHPKPEFGNKLHGVIIVVKANDERLRVGGLKDYLTPVRDVLRRRGIAPITVVTHRDTLSTDEECENALYEASAATGSSPSHTFFVANYTREKSNRDPKIERMIFDILHYALLTAERAVKIMKQKERNKEEDETLRALSGTSVSGQVAPDSADASVDVFLRFLQKEYQWSSGSVKTVVNQLSKDDVTSVKLLATCWEDVQGHFSFGMKKMVEKELRNRGLIP